MEIKNKNLNIFFFKKVHFFFVADCLFALGTTVFIELSSGQKNLKLLILFK